MPNGTSLDTLLVDQYTGGVNMPNAAQANYVAVANASGTNLDYKTAATAIVSDDTLATALAPNLRGMGLTVDTNHNLQVRPRPRKYIMQDFFITGNTTSGSIGAFGWNLLGVGSPSIVNVSGGSLTARKFSIQTSSSINDTAILCMGSVTTIARVNMQNIQLLQAAGIMGNELTSKRWFFGGMADMAAEPSVATDCFGLMYDSALGTDYKIINRVGSVGVPVSTGVTVPINSNELLSIYLPDGSSTWLFYSGNTLIGSVAAAVSTASLNLGWRLQTLAAASKIYRPIYFGLESMIAGDYIAGDTFLEV